MTDEVKKYWDSKETQSMVDKDLIEIETNAILGQLEAQDRVLDVGCGEGESTVRYFEKVGELTAIDYSETRIEKLKESNDKISTILMDMRELRPDKFKSKFDKVITQRSLINLKDFNEQIGVIKRIHSLLNKNGKYIMLEGFNEGVEEVNRIRNDFGLKSIPVRWHNRFFNKRELLDSISSIFKLEYERDFSLYFFLTRVFKSTLIYPEEPKYHDDFNRLAKEMEIAYRNEFIRGVSRLELLVFSRI